jgi:hypothetical protein
VQKPFHSHNDYWYVPFCNMLAQSVHGLLEYSMCGLAIERRYQSQEPPCAPFKEKLPVFLSRCQIHIL